MANDFYSLAVISLGIGLALFGAKANEQWSVTYDRSTSKFFEWGYWCGCCGALLDLVAILLYTCHGCRANPHEGYTRGEVV